VSGAQSAGKITGSVFYPQSPAWPNYFISIPSIRSRG
jgi:hypothetical protein